MMIRAPELPSPSEWGWKRVEGSGWKYVGALYLKLLRLVGNLYAVAAKRDAEDDASIIKLLYHALLFVCAVDFALINLIINSPTNTLNL